MSTKSGNKAINYKALVHVPVALGIGFALNAWRLGLDPSSPEYTRILYAMVADLVYVLYAFHRASTALFVDMVGALATAFAWVALNVCLLLLTAKFLNHTAAGVIMLFAILFASVYGAIKIVGRKKKYWQNLVR